MKASYRVLGVSAFCATLSLSAVGALADPILPQPPATIPAARPARVIEPPQFTRAINNVTLDYDKATQNSSEVLRARVSVTFKDAPFLSALDAVMNAAPTTCRVECRQVGLMRLSMNVKDVSMAGLLDALAKFSGGRLYVLPSKLIIAPEKALTEDEKKKAKLYGVLLTAATLPNTPQAKALTQANYKYPGGYRSEGNLKFKAADKSILDFANTKISMFGNSPLGAMFTGGLDTIVVPPDAYTPKLLSSVDYSDLAALVYFSFDEVNFGDALASFAHMVGYELYLTPEHFIICAPEHLNDPENRPWTQNAIRAFQSQSIMPTDSSESST